MVKEKRGSVISRACYVTALCFVVGLMILPISAQVKAAAPSSPYTPGYLYKIHDGSHYWDDSEQPLKYWINAGTIPSGLDTTAVVNEIKAAFQAWQDDLGSYVAFSYQGTTTRTHTSSDDGYNVVYWGDSIAVAQCDVWYSGTTGRIVDADICFERDGVSWGIYPCPDKVDIRAVATHEVGHFLGLDDVTGTTAVDLELTMCPQNHGFNDIDQRSLEYGDRAGVRYLYGGFNTVATSIGSYQAGAGNDIGDVDGVTGKDMLCAWVDNPSGNNYIYYRLGKQISTTTGAVSSWTSTSKWSTSIGSYTQGMGVALASIGLGAAIDLVFGWMDNPSGSNTMKYVIGWDLSTSGVPSSWSSVKTMPTDGVTWDSTGMDIKVVDCVGTTRPDLVVFWGDEATTNYDSMRHRIGKDMDTSGNVGSSSWTPVTIFTTNYETEGCGVCVGNFDLTGSKDIMFVIMEYMTGPGYTNKITYKVGWNIDANGIPTGWTGWTSGPVGWIGTATDGVGVTCANINGLASEEIFYFWVDDPSSTGNSCYYRVEWEGRVAYSHP
jgi:hypothetical protein